MKILKIQLLTTDEIKKKEKRNCVNDSFGGKRKI